MSTLVRAENVCLSYPSPDTGLKSLFGVKRTMPLALDHMTFEIESGDRLALVGLNGSGKSTLLRAMAGILLPDSGTLEVNGDTVALFSLGIGMRMDSTGRHNIILQGMMNGHSQADMERLMPEIIAFSELGDVIDDPVHTYSQGMGVRLSFAVATALKPDILLLDEWIGAGDRVFRDKAQKRLESMVSDARGLVLASHNVHIVRKYCNKALWISQGKILVSGDVEEVLEAFESGT